MATSPSLQPNATSGYAARVVPGEDVVSLIEFVVAGVLLFACGWALAGWLSIGVDVVRSVRERGRGQ